MASIALPRRMLVGGGTVKQTASLLLSMGLSKPLIVSDAFLANSGTVDKVLQATKGIKCDVFTDTIPDPTTDSVDLCRAKIESGDFDSIIAVGGGSPMDTAKAAAATPSAPRKFRRLMNLLLGFLFM